MWDFDYSFLIIKLGTRGQISYILSVITLKLSEAIAILTAMEAVCILFCIAILFNYIFC